MKKILAFVLVFALVLGVGVVAFAAKSPAPSPANGGYTTRTATTTGNDIELLNANDEVVATVPAGEVINIPVGQADKLSDADKEAFLAEYDRVKEIKDRVVKYFFWLDIPAKYKTADVAYAKYPFTCTGENVEVTVNGKSMEVVSEGGASYVAKLTEFGAVAILCD